MIFRRFAAVGQFRKKWAMLFLGIDLRDGVVSIFGRRVSLTPWGLISMSSCSRNHLSFIKTCSRRILRKSWSAVSKACSNGLTRSLTLLVMIYRSSAALVLGGNCRFEPSCSTYALEALALHTPLFATRLILKRLSHCHPWGPCGYDPVPGRKDSHE